ncbi:hydrogenase [Methanoculleus taiwanensis]|uniref:Hydrogenase n=1 Tax=Methanoculleus taiwanensis TaxID=1550565 RepID=A0A498H286_9EURY|nr:hydrogen gas-evolving membrane-bound hydrogenase subunit E [Methanoculleus taiwanensis]RXE56220.1 hydrogenase [Methanoculleus taiwanensis]
MKQYVKIAVLLVLLAAFLVPVMTLEFGDPAATEMDDYFLRYGQEQTGGNNIVADVLMDYRGFDTLGEATVLLTAVLAVGLVFRRLFGGEEHEYE